MVRAMAAKKAEEGTKNKSASANSTDNKKRRAAKSANAGQSKQKASADSETMENAKPKSKKEEGELPETATHIFQFIKEVDIERRKITWPDRNQVIRETWGVLILVALLTFMVLGFDWAVAKFIFGPLEHQARLHGGGVGHPSD
jgi:preprotein translocase subunit SecE